MATIRVSSRRRFTSVDRAAVNNVDLSFRARGLLVWLLDKPDDWRVDSASLARSGTEGREAVRTALRELESAGYLVRSRIQVAGGRWSTEVVVIECPGSPVAAPAGAQESVAGDTTEDGFPGAGFPVVGSPVVGSPVVGSPVVGFSGAIPLSLIPNTETTPPAAPPGRARKVKPPAFGPEAKALAATEWESRTRKPVAGFPALAERCQEALDAGHEPAAIAAALKRATVFSRNGLDFALSQGTSPTRTVDSRRDEGSGRLAAGDL